MYIHHLGQGSKSTARAVGDAVRELNADVARIIR